MSLYKSKGKILVKRSGYYFVYSQMYYRGDGNFPDERGQAIYIQHAHIHDHEKLGYQRKDHLP